MREIPRFARDDIVGAFYDFIKFEFYSIGAYSLHARVSVDFAGIRRMPILIKARSDFMRSDFIFAIRPAGLLFSGLYRKGEPMKERVLEVIEKIRPMLKADGGDVELIDVGEDGVVKVRLQGACAGCPMSQMTLKNGIERLLKKEIPEVKSVESA